MEVTLSGISDLSEGAAQTLARKWADQCRFIVHLLRGEWFCERLHK
jgi:hypothetical protein